MTEKLPTSQELKVERIPTYDSFGNTNEALSWVLERLSITYKPSGVKIWWTNPHTGLEGISPSETWEIDPDKVIRLAAGIEN
jgi:hypothetical protein